MSRVMIGTQELGKLLCHGSEPMSTRGSGSGSEASCGGGTVGSCTSGVVGDGIAGELLATGAAAVVEVAV